MKIIYNTQILFEPVWEIFSKNFNSESHSSKLDFEQSLGVISACISEQYLFERGKQSIRAKICDRFESCIEKSDHVYVIALFMKKNAFYSNMYQENISYTHILDRLDFFVNNVDKKDRDFCDYQEKYPFFDIYIKRQIHQPLYMILHGIEQKLEALKVNPDFSFKKSFSYDQSNLMNCIMIINMEYKSYLKSFLSDYIYCSEPHESNNQPHWVIYSVGRIAKNEDKYLDILDRRYALVQKARSCHFFKTVQSKKQNKAIFRFGYSSNNQNSKDISINVSPESFQGFDCKMTRKGYQKNFTLSLGNKKEAEDAEALATSGNYCNINLQGVSMVDKLKCNRFLLEVQTNPSDLKNEAEIFKMSLKLYNNYLINTFYQINLHITAKIEQQKPNLKSCSIKVYKDTKNVDPVLLTHFGFFLTMDGTDIDLNTIFTDDQSKKNFKEFESLIENYSDFLKYGGISCPPLGNPRTCLLNRLSKTVVIDHHIALIEERLSLEPLKAFYYLIERLGLDLNNARLEYYIFDTKTEASNHQDVRINHPDSNNDLLGLFRDHIRSFYKTDIGMPKKYINSVQDEIFANNSHWCLLIDGEDDIKWLLGYSNKKVYNYMTRENFKKLFAGIQQVIISELVRLNFSEYIHQNLQNDHLIRISYNLSNFIFLMNIEIDEILSIPLIHDFLEKNHFDLVIREIVHKNITNFNSHSTPGSSESVGFLSNDNLQSIKNLIVIEITKFRKLMETDFKVYEGFFICAKTTEMEKYENLVNMKHNIFKT